jgi:hypothetical protein
MHPKTGCKLSQGHCTIVFDMINLRQNVKKESNRKDNNKTEINDLMEEKQG